MCMHVAVSKPWGAFRCSANCCIGRCSLAEQAILSAEQFATRRSGLQKNHSLGHFSCLLQHQGLQIRCCCPFPGTNWSSQEKVWKREISEFLTVVRSSSLCYSCLFSPNKGCVIMIFHFLTWNFFLFCIMGSHIHPHISEYFSMYCGYFGILQSVN